MEDTKEKNQVQESELVWIAFYSPKNTHKKARKLAIDMDAKSLPEMYLKIFERGLETFELQKAS